jgi:uncharacterized protein DUF5996
LDDIQSSETESISPKASNPPDSLARGARERNDHSMTAIDELRDLPALPLSEWEPTRLQLHLIAQIVGKIRLALHPPMNHWWHVTSYVSPRGLTTGAIPNAGRSFEVEIDLIDDAVVLRTSEGEIDHVPIGPRPIAECFEDVIELLEVHGVRPAISTRPYKCKSDVPFEQDRVHTAWDREAIARAFSALRRIEAVFKDFRGRFIGKASPVHVFWHSLDLALTRFSGRRAPPLVGADRVTVEAYSHEVSSAGFWFGDDRTPEAAFYSYAAPVPRGLTDHEIRPSSARWTDAGGSPLAILRYEDVRRAKNPRATLLDFLESTYEAAANAAEWDRAALEAPER